MFPFADVVHFFPYKFTRLGARGFALAFITPGPCDSFLFRHNAFLSASADGLTRRGFGGAIGLLPGFGFGFAIRH
jgi:hypothetical protein